MGIPKFYRWISERYPCLSEKIREYQIPEFDNLYLDMNGIIHSCSHPNDEDIHLRIPEKSIFGDISQYIDFLLKMIKPRKVFFMAVDGVAPRAKMNQQRGRRFRSAKLAEDQEAEALRKGEILPAEERFDSNCITPGTVFMARLHEHLQYFIKVKVSTDPLWQRQGLSIILSGHDVPGEGEHKIMDYIRHIRSQPDYDPDTRHCLYGLDADLIMLGLSTHELRFSLLREEVKFTRPKKQRKWDRKRKSYENSYYDPTCLPAPLQQNFVPASIVTTNGNVSFAEAAAKGPASLDRVNTQQTISSNANLDAGAKGKYRAPLPEKTTFFLLHLSLLRDYIDEEFQGLRKALENHPTVKYDLEKVIDDWILLSILVGNDFVPHLPMLHIVKGAFPMLYTTYAEVLPMLDGYLSENGKLHLGRFESFLQVLSAFDLHIFRETYDDMKYMESKTGRTIVLGDTMFDVGTTQDEEDAEDEISSAELKALIARTDDEIKDGHFNSSCSAFYVSPNFFDAEDSMDFRVEFFQYKRNYYMEKMGLKDVTKEKLRSMAQEYVRAIQWVLLYYYKGVSSWGWFYPEHYAPFCSDINNLPDLNMEFVKGMPFKPFEQLLGVLPSQSGKFLPKCFHELMVNTESPIIDFYPKEFENDLNGKRADWEAVVLIPFIDELRLLSAMKKNQKLTDEEKRRNLRGQMHLYMFIPRGGDPIRSLDEMFPTLYKSHYLEEKFDDVDYNKGLLPKGLHPKAKPDKIYQGFPSLKSIAHTSALEKTEIKIFEFYARDESMILQIARPKEMGLKVIAKRILGKTIWVNWPHLTLIYVTGISNANEKLVSQHTSNKVLPLRDFSYDPRTHEGFWNVLTERHLKFKGIRLSESGIIVWGVTMEGRRIRPGPSGEVRVEEQWGWMDQPYAIDTIINSDVEAKHVLDRQLPNTYLDIFQPGDCIITIYGHTMGSRGIVRSIDHLKRLVCIEVEFADSVHTEESLANLLSGKGLNSRYYYSSAEVAAKLGIPAFAVAKMTGTVYINPTKRTVVSSGKSRNRKKIEEEDSQEEGKGWKDNIGLDLKFNKRNLEVRGYSRRVDGQWMYSKKAVDAMQEYWNKFPEVVQFFSKNSNGVRDSYSAEDIFPENTQNRLQELLDWMEAKDFRHLPRVQINSKVLDDEDVLVIYQLIYNYLSTVQRLKKSIRVQPHYLYKPGINRGCIGVEDTSVDFDVLDRVVCVDPSGPLAIGQRGTVIGIQNPLDEEKQEEEAFRSTSATALKTLIVLPDPVVEGTADSALVKPTYFEGQTDSFGGMDEYDKLRSSLLRILKIRDRRDSFKELVPKLVIFYPFQLLNITHHLQITKSNQGKKLAHAYQLANNCANTFLIPKHHSHHKSASHQYQNSNTASHLNAQPNITPKNTQAQREPTAPQIQILRRTPQTLP